MYLIYLRKSRQDDPSETVEEVLARHEKILQEFAIKSLGFRIDEANIYREVVSGETIEDRVEIKHIFERMQTEDIKAVLVVEPQRLTRGDMLDCGTVVHTFRYTNTLIMTPPKTYDLSDKYDRKFFEMELTRGNDYLEYTKEILARGRSASAHAGNYIGGIAPYGYDRVRIDKSPTLKINEKEASVVRLIYDLYINENLGYREIASRLDTLGIKTRNNIYFNQKVINDILINPVYVGLIKYKYREEVKVIEDGKLVKKRKVNKDCELIKGKHEPIITQAQYEAVQARKGRNTTLISNAQLRNVFAGILKCKKCGRAIGRKYDSKKQNKDRYFCRNTHCDTVSEEVAKVDEAIIGALKDAIKDFELILKGQTPNVIKYQKESLEVLNQRLKDADIKQARLYDLLEEGIYSSEVFLARSELLNHEKEQIKKAIDDLNVSIPKKEHAKDMIVTLHQAIDLINDDKADKRAVNTFLKSFIEAIYYEKNETRYKHCNANELKLEIKFK